MFTDVYNRGKHFKPYRLSLIQCVTDSRNKAHFEQCLAVLVLRAVLYGPFYMGCFQLRNRLWLSSKRFR